MSFALSLQDLTASGAHQRGHFLLSSGLHSADYLQCALHLAHPKRAEAAGVELAAELRHILERPADLVVAPALGGLIIGHEVARALDLPFIFTERADGEMALRRGFVFPKDAAVVVVEDVVTTGKSTREVFNLIHAAGASVIAMASVVNRAASDNPFDPVPYRPLLRVSFPTWPAPQCPLCAKGLPVEKPGSRQVPVE